MPFEQINVKLFKLHGYWLTADAVEEAMRAYLNTETPHEPDMPDELNQFGKIHSVFSVQKVLYALIYVVIEEYKASDFEDEKLDELLADEVKVQMLRRFRNAIFHVQNEVLSQKELDFLDADYDGSWIKAVHKAFDKYFTERLDLEKRIRALKEAMGG
ncbi:MAG: hypothetical protein GXP06_08715 [Alphaproteobacteria bacterium]|nr:hypothetical protein [Alphaproteobacteria bacterium]